MHVNAKKLFDLFQIFFLITMSEFSDNDDDHLPENSKSFSYLEKRLGSNSNANDTIADEGENVLNSPTTKNCDFLIKKKKWLLLSPKMSEKQII